MNARTLSALLLTGIALMGRASADMGPLKKSLGVGQSGAWTTTIEKNGGYRMMNTRDPNMIRYYAINTPRVQDGKRVISVDVEVAGNKFSHAGLFYGFRKAENFYYFLALEPGRKVTLYRRDKTGLRSVIGVSGDSIKPGRNTLRIEENGKSIAISVNGKRLSSLQSTGTGTGGFGICAWGTGRFTFNNFSLKHKDGATKPLQKRKPIAPNIEKLPGNPAAGKKRLHLKVVNIYDRTGFGKPVLAMRFLAPKDWKIKGGIKWNIVPDASKDIIDIGFRATSPDGKYALEMFPITVSDWADDPMYVRIAKRAPGGAKHLPPMSAAQWVRNVLIPRHRKGARIVDFSPDAKLKKALIEERNKKYANFEELLRVKFTTDAARVRIQTPGDASEELVFAATHVTIAEGLSPSAAAQGLFKKMNIYKTYSDRVSSWRAPKGKLVESAGLMRTMIDSIQVNPVWQATVDNVRANIARIKLEGVIARQKIWNKVSQEIATIRHRSWLRTQKSNDAIHRKFVQAIRGVGNYRSADGTTIELPYGYNVAWSNGNEVILSPNVGFNANEHYQGTWTLHEPVR